MAKTSHLFYLFFQDLIYLFLERSEGREKERERNIESISSLSHAPSLGPGLPPRHMPSVGIEPVTFRFAGHRSIHIATSARAKTSYLDTNQK